MILIIIEFFFHYSVNLNIGNSKFSPRIINEGREYRLYRSRLPEQIYKIIPFRQTLGLYPVGIGMFVKTEDGLVRRIARPRPAGEKNIIGKKSLNESGSEKISQNSAVADNYGSVNGDIAFNEFFRAVRHNLVVNNTAVSDIDRIYGIDLSADFHIPCRHCRARQNRNGNNRKNFFY